MKFFKLPDLGEGLAEAEIVEWKVSAGDIVSVDQVLLSVETAKALVDVPSPVAGVIARLCGQEGDILHIGAPLVEFEGGEDDGTVVGKLFCPGGLVAAAFHLHHCINDVGVTSLKVILVVVERMTVCGNVV